MYLLTIIGLTIESTDPQGELRLRVNNFCSDPSNLLVNSSVGIVEKVDE